MARFIAQRLVLAFATLLVVSLLVFAATQVLPGNAATSILGKSATPERIEALERQLNLNEPVPQQYLNWLGSFLQGDPGESIASRTPVGELLSTRLANSATLAILAAMIMLPLALSLGVWSAINRDKKSEGAVSVVILALAALPEFVIAILLVLLLSTSAFHVFPAVSLIPPESNAWQEPSLLVLPTAALVLAVTPYVCRIMRGSMIEVLDSDYVEMARLKGLNERSVIWRHALPNAIVPALQVSAAQLAWLAGGMVLVEFVFSYPGVGTALIDAVNNRDVPVIQAIVLFIAAIYVVLNLIADILTIILTPKLRTAMK